MSLRISAVHRLSGQARQRARARRSRRLWALEGLEGRVLLSGNPTYYTVNLTSDTGACSGTDAYPTAGTPSGDLLWAITQANANTNPAGSIIEFDPNVFATPQTITLSSTLALSESAGPEVIDGPSAGVVISGNNAVEVFQVNGGVTGTLADLTISGGISQTNGGGIFVDYDSTLTVSDSTITDCAISANAAALGYAGGGIFNNGALTVSGSTIEDNSAGSGGGIENRGIVTITGGSTIEGNSAGAGGGVYNYATLTVNGSTIEGNSATYGGSSLNGGGILNYSGCTTTVTDSTVEDNTAPVDGYGGGIGSYGTLTITDSTISGNTAGIGGGVGFYGTTTITGCTFEGNVAASDSEGGGAIWNDGSMLTVADSTIEGNLSLGEGGGGGITNDTLATLIDCTIDDNTASRGGGISNGGTLSIIDSTIAGNSTATFANGGGIFNGGTLTAVNSTIVYNDGGFNYYNDESSTGGGGVYDLSGATATLYSTIVAANTADDGPDDIAGAGVCSASAYNLVGVDETGSLSNGTSGNLVIGTANPGLGLLAYNGGPTQTIALFAGSPAIDAGSVAVANEYSLTTDQRGPGYSRIVNGTVDIGAFERPAAASIGPATVYTVDLTSDTGASTGADSGDLAYVISQADMNPNLAGSVIEFAPTVFSAANPQTITLTGTLELGEPSGPLVIDGPGAARSRSAAVVPSRSFSPSPAR